MTTPPPPTGLPPHLQAPLFRTRGRSRQQRRLLRPLLAGLLSLASAASAADEPPRFALSGFGTFGLTRSDKDNYRFHSSNTQPSSMPGQNFDPSTDSVLGVQGTARLADKFDLTVQAVTRQAAGYDYTPHITWAYLHYRPTPALSLRAGRTTTPFFMFSDSLNVNYATPWLRPPAEVYSLNPFSDLDGVDALYRAPLGDMDLEIQGLAGQSAVLTRSASGRLRNARGIRVGLAGTGFSAQAGYTRTDLQLHWTDGLHAALGGQLAATGEIDAMNELSGIHSNAEFFSAGFQWEKNNWITIAEFAKRRVDRYISTAHAWYITVGHRIDAFTPYLTYANQTQDNPAFDAAVTAVHTPLVNLYNNSRNTAQHSLAIGSRWDVARNIALKGQIERITPAPHSRGLFPSGNLEDYYRPTTPVHLLSLSVDFVF
ncbi:hypothetical protein [Zoogloea sp.]|uniref:hypothetical protein n=1 Tax=Zoogloea sp. TaxID=49181 RepID=UPI0035B4DE8C